MRLPLGFCRAGGSEAWAEAPLTILFRLPGLSLMAPETLGMFVSGQLLPYVNCAGHRFWR